MAIGVFDAYGTMQKLLLAHMDRPEEGHTVAHHQLLRLPTRPPGVRGAKPFIRRTMATGEASLPKGSLDRPDASAVGASRQVEHGLDVGLQELVTAGRSTDNNTNNTVGSTPNTSEGSTPSSSNPMPRFVVLKTLGKGAQGFVQLAEDTRRENQRVAVKYIRKEVARSYYKYVVREILNHQELSLSRHPHIVEFLEVFVTPKYLGVVMEYVDGINLHAYLAQQGGTLSQDISRFIFQQLIIVMQFCHRLGKSHRDIKLGNILVLSGGQLQLPLIKLCDFGFSKDRDVDSEARTAIGTALFAAPEVIQSGGDKPYLADVADVLYSLLFGGHPFLTSDQLTSRQTFVVDMLERIQSGGIIVPPGSEQSMGGAIDILRKMLVADPARRITMADVVQHPWFLQRLPAGTLDLNRGYLEAAVFRQARQSAEVTAHILLAACCDAGSWSTEAQVQEYLRDLQDKRNSKLLQLQQELHQHMLQEQQMRHQQQMQQQQQQQMQMLLQGQGQLQQMQQQMQRQQQLGLQDQGQGQPYAGAQPFPSTGPGGPGAGPWASWSSKR